MSEPCILFEVAGTTYAVPALDVRQVEMIEQVTRVPNSPHYVDGLVYLRGKVVPVVNLRRLFGFEGRDHDISSRLLVVDVAGRLVGLAVDAAREFAWLNLSAMQPPPENLSTRAKQCMRGILSQDTRLVVALDVARALESDEGLISAVDAIRQTIPASQHSGN